MLKVDVEGSEFAFLENALDYWHDLPTDQLAIEWHHYDIDNRYGADSSGQVNAIVALLLRRNLKLFYMHPSWRLNDDMFKKAGMYARISLASFIRTPTGWF